jgi:Flp pilus assembly protein TadG
MTPPALPEPRKTNQARSGRAMLARFLRRQNGAAAIEFALVAAPTIALVLAILQIGLVYFAEEALETTVEDTARLVLTGQAQSEGLTQSQFGQALCNKSPGLFTCSNFMINLQPAASFATVNTAAPTLTYDSHGNVTNTWQYNPGNPGDIMVMQVMYQWPVFLGPLGFNLSNLSNGTRLLMSTAVFRNEP